MLTVTLVASATLAVLDAVASALVLRILNYCFPLSYFDFAQHRFRARYREAIGCVGRVVCSQVIRAANCFASGSLSHWSLRRPSALAKWYLLYLRLAVNRISPFNAILRAVMT